MPGPGEYRPDPTVGIARTEDLPKTKVSIQSRNYRRRPCPRCGHSAYRDRHARRTLHDLGNTLTGRPATSLCSIPSIIAPVAGSTSAPIWLTWPTPAAITRAASPTSPSGWSSRTACPIAPPNGPSGATTACLSLTPRSRTGSRPGGKGAADRYRASRLGTVRLLGLHRC